MNKLLSLSKKWFLRTVLILISIFVFSLGCQAPENSENTDKMGNAELIFSEDFENYDPSLWNQTDPNAWQLDSIDGNRYISLIQQSIYEPPYRSPHNINLIDSLVVKDFIITMKAKSTKGDYNHRDLCVFFGYQDSANFYYAHLGMKADNHAHSIFIVNDSARVSIAAERTDTLTWGGKWHDVKIIRDSKSGDIEIYFDDMQQPIMIAKDTTFSAGKIGIGSFDDTGYFDDINVFSPNSDNK